jgi:hypothetical protein
MKDGPVPSFIYDVIKGNTSAAMREIIKNRLEFAPRDQYYAMYAVDVFDDLLFSRTDISSLDESIELYADMPFGQLWTLVHCEEAYVGSYVVGTSIAIPYDLMLPSKMVDREKIIDQMSEISRVVAI